MMDFENRSAADFPVREHRKAQKAVICTPASPEYRYILKDLGLGDVDAKTFEADIVAFARGDQVDRGDA